MTVGKLIELLSKFPPETLVVHEDENGIFPAVLSPTGPDDPDQRYERLDADGNKLPKGTI